MNEVEKMYRNSGVEKHKKAMLDIETGKDVLTLDSFYPEFTVEKQIKIMELLGEVHAFFDADKTNFVCITNCRIEKGIIKGYEGKGASVSEALARLINNLWQDLTEEERKQIKEILE